MKNSARLLAYLCLSASLQVSGQLAHAQTNAIASGNWSTPATWSAGEPSETNSAIINGGFTVTVDQGGEYTDLIDVGTISGQVGNLNILPGAQLGLFGVAPDPTALRLGQTAGSTGNLTMSGGEVYISEDIPDAFDSGDLVVGNSGTGTATISGGTLTAADEVVLAQSAGGSGTLSISNATLNVARRSLLVGFAYEDTEASLPGGHGELNISGTAQVNVAGWMQTSFGTGSTSVINQTGGEVNITGLLVHAARGTSTYNHSGGKSAGDLMIIGDGVGDVAANGTYNISNTAELDWNAMIVGSWGNSQGTFNQSGGTVNVARRFLVGDRGTGTYNMSGGTLTSEGLDGDPAFNHLLIGLNGGNGTTDPLQGTGYFNQTNGAVTVKTGVFLGNFDNSEGYYKISGGTLNVGGGSNAGNGTIEDFVGDFSVGGALASNASLTRVEPTNNNDAQGQASAAKGIFIVSGSSATINIAGNFLANPADKSDFRSDVLNPGTSNSATLGFEIFNSSGTSLINVGGVADLDGAVIDLDLMSGFTPTVNTTFDLLKASSFGSTGTGTTQNVGTGEGFFLASEDVGGWSLAVVASGGFEYLRATFLGSVGIAGDLNGDGFVNGRDFLFWQRGGTSPAFSPAKLSEWQTAYNGGALAGVNAVPEPGSFVLISALGVIACLGRSRRS